MALLLYRLGHWCVRRRRFVLVAWVALLVVIGVWSNAAGGTTSETLSIPGTESQDAADLLDERFPAQAGTTIRVAIEAPEGRTISDFGSQADLEAGLERVFLLPHVVPPADPLSAVTMSPDGRIAFIEIRFDQSAVDLDKEEIRTIIASTDEATPATLKVAFSGEVVSKAVAEPHPPSELIGFAVAIVVLLIAFGSVLAMGLPLLTALIGVGVAVLGISLLSAFTELTSVAPTLAIMIGLAVGIDYALFIVTRHRAFFAAGLDPAESAARANATSGGAVVFAGVHRDHRPRLSRRRRHPVPHHDGPVRRSRRRRSPWSWRSPSCPRCSASPARTSTGSPSRGSRSPPAKASRSTRRSRDASPSASPTGPGRT